VGSFKGVLEIVPDERRQGFVSLRHAIHRHALGRVHQTLKIRRGDPS